MSARPPIKIRHSFQNTYPYSAQKNWVGAQSQPYQRGWWANMPTVAIGVGTAYIAGAARIGNICYIVGNFTSVGGQTRNYAAAFNLYTGELEDWNPNISSLTEAVAVGKNEDGVWQVYVAGTFATVNGSVTRNNLARFDQDGVVDADWDPNVNGTVYDVAYRSASSILLCGTFTQVGASTRNRAAEVDGTTGAVTATNPNLGGTANALAVDAENGKLYLVGAFTTAAGGTARNRACRWDLAGNSLDSWDPNLGAAAHDVAFRSTESVLIVGEFTTTAGGGTTRNRAAEFSSGGIATPWNPNLDDICYSVTVSASGQVVPVAYLGGAFTTVGGVARNRLASLDLSGAGTLRAWDPNANSTALYVEVFDRTVVAGGIFTTINGAAAVAGKGIPDPLFTDANAIFISKSTGDDSNPGTQASPKKTINGAVGTTASLLEDISGNGNDLTQAGSVLNPEEGIIPAMHGNYMAGPFSDADYFDVPAAVGTAIAASNEFAVELRVFIADMTVVNTTNMLWQYKDATGATSLRVSTTGQVIFKLQGTDNASAAGTIQTKREYRIKITYNGTTDAKRIYVDGALLVDTTQAGVTMGAQTDQELGRNVDAANQYLIGFMDDVRIYNDSAATSLVAWYDFETKSAVEDLGGNYAVILDSEVYNEEVNVFQDGVELYAADGQAPTIRITPGAESGTYGARREGREKFSGGAGSTFCYVAKNGNDATGSRGNESLPFLTVQAAVTASSTGDTIQIQDSGVYEEDIVCGAKALIFQAKDGEVPTLLGRSQLAAGVTIDVTANNTLKLYGLRLEQRAGSLASSIGPDSDLEAYDCTFFGGANAIEQVAASTRAWQIHNSAFYNHTGIQITSKTLSFTMRNCYFAGGASYAMSVEAATLDVDMVTMEKCELGMIVNTTTLGTKRLHKLNRILGQDIDNIGVTADLTSSYTFAILKNSEFHRVAQVVATSAGVRFGRTGGVTSSSILTAVRSLLLVDCSTAGAATGALQSINTSGGGGQKNIFYGIRDVAVLRPGYDGFNFGSVTSGCFGFTFNCSVNGASNYGFHGTFSQGEYQFGGPNITGLAEANSGVGGFLVSGTLFATAWLTYCVFEGSVNDATAIGTGTSLQDPRFLSDVEGVENLSVSPSGPCILAGNSERSNSVGAGRQTLTLSGPGCAVDGVIIQGRENLFGGVRAGGSSSEFCAVSYCTFMEDWFYSAMLSRNSLATNCLLSQSRGNGVVPSGSGLTVSRNAGVTVAGAFIVNGKAGMEIKNNSSYSCLYGQYDLASYVADQANNIYSESTVYDYQGGDEQLYSDIGTLGPLASVDANSGRLNPLFRNAAGGDLRLQAIAAGVGNKFNSPALESGSDGDDMGAFSFHYGPVVQEYTQIELDTPYRNPDTLTRGLEAIKLAEGVDEAGRTYSNAMAYKMVYRFGWNESENDMPEEQVAALREVYEAEDNFVQIDFGDGFLDCFTLKETPFEYSEMTGGYSSDEIPTPVRQMAFREA